MRELSIVMISMNEEKAVANVIKDIKLAIPCGLATGMPFPWVC